MLESASVRRIRQLIISGFILIVITLAVSFGPGIYQELTRPILIGDGDSLMAAGPQLYAVAEKLSNSTDRTWDALNLAKPGQRVGVEIIASNLQGAPHLKFPWAMRVVWLMGGTNDLAASKGGPEAVEKLLSDVESYFRNLHKQGYSENTCFYTDILPRSNTANPRFEEDRLSFNSKIQNRLTNLAHVIPSGETLSLQDPQDLHFFVDGVHLSGFGSKVAADDAFKTMDIYLK